MDSLQESQKALLKSQEEVMKSLERNGALIKKLNKFIIGVDPANGKDQAIYNGKVVK